jgi:hypothetical protein
MVRKTKPNQTEQTASSAGDRPTQAPTATALLGETSPTKAVTHPQMWFLYQQKANGTDGLTHHGKN